jgi:hypothetical protein
MAKLRRLAVLGAALAVAMIVVGYRAAIDAAGRGFKIDSARDPLAFLVFPLGDLSAFTVLVALARRDALGSPRSGEWSCARRARCLGSRSRARAYPASRAPACR